MATQPLLPRQKMCPKLHSRAQYLSFSDGQERSFFDAAFQNALENSVTAIICVRIAGGSVGPSLLGWHAMLIRILAPD